MTKPAITNVTCSRSCSACVRRAPRRRAQARARRRRPPPRWRARPPGREKQERARAPGGRAPAARAAGREDEEEQRARQPEQHERRGSVADHDVLEHVDREQVLLADRVDRRHEREHEQGQPEPERDGSPPGSVIRPAATAKPHEALHVEGEREARRREDRGREVPGGVELETGTGRRAPAPSRQGQEQRSDRRERQRGSLTAPAFPPRTPPVAEGDGSGPEHDRRDRDDDGEGRAPVSDVRERRHAFPCDRSQRAKLVKPIITASIQYCDRVASWGLA